MRCAMLLLLLAGCVEVSPQDEIDAEPVTQIDAGTQRPDALVTPDATAQADAAPSTDADLPYGKACNSPAECCAGHNCSLTCCASDLSCHLPGECL